MAHDSFFSCPLLTADAADFPVRLTQRAHRVFTAGWNPIPFLRPFKYLALRWDEENDRPDWNYEKKYDPGTQILGRFPRLSVIVPKDDVEVLKDFVLDFGYWPLCGDGTQWYYPFAKFSRASHPGLLPLSNELLIELHPELFAPFREAGPAEQYGDAWGRQFARDTIAYRTYVGDTRAAVVVLTQPLIVAAYASDFDNVLLLRFPDAYGEEAVPHFELKPGRRLVTVNGFGNEGETVSDLRSDKPLTQWKNFQPIIGEFVSEDEARLAELRAQIEEEEWDRCAELAAARFKAGTTFRDGRPILSFMTPEFRKDYPYPYGDFVPTTL